MAMAAVGKLFKGVLILGIVVSAVFAPFMLTIWKEKQLRDLSLKREELNGEILRLQSRTATLEISIERLSAGERLERYALDSMGMVQPDPLKIVAVERDQHGAVVVQRDGIENFLYKLMGN